MPWPFGGRWYAPKNVTPGVPAGDHSCKCLITQMTLVWYDLSHGCLWCAFFCCLLLKMSYHINDIGPLFHPCASLYVLLMSVFHLLRMCNQDIHIWIVLHLCVSVYVLWMRVCVLYDRYNLDGHIWTAKVPHGRFWCGRFCYFPLKMSDHTNDTGGAALVPPCVSVWCAISFLLPLKMSDHINHTWALVHPCVSLYVLLMSFGHTFQMHNQDGHI